jgi:hypothetical protein
VRVPELRSSTPLAITRCSQQRYGEVLLDNAFSLIEGHPACFAQIVSERSLLTRDARLDRAILTHR